MTYKKKLFKATIWIFSIFSILALVLVIHIAMVTKPNNSHHSNWQLSRIDFTQSLDSAQAQLAMKTIQSISGVKHAYVNNAQGTLVYSYEAGHLKSADVFDAFIAKTNFEAKPYKAPKMEDATGCPVIDKSSLTYRFTTFVQNTLR
ncbi:hypothetical protein [Chondrinema litorale]|uniref:hypothetical protein n=1 Tax=Chondrinema litorale TaxID=2994555 RepID=UPI0025437BA2|nr:hypothetical protein [Chondrinema litorale]UZR96562.1 hypothetical protein OQ292_20660 [Chondrinema litorale]